MNGLTEKQAENRVKAFARLCKERSSVLNLIWHAIAWDSPLGGDIHTVAANCMDIVAYPDLYEKLADLAREAWRRGELKTATQQRHTEQRSRR
jgi:hypothetical protein